MDSSKTSRHPDVKGSNMNILPKSHENYQLIITTAGSKTGSACKL